MPERATALNGQTFALWARYNGTGTTLITTADRGIEIAISGAQEPQGWHEATKHQPDPIHHSFDVNQSRLFSMRLRLGIFLSRQGEPLQQWIVVRICSRPCRLWNILGRRESPSRFGWCCFPNESERRDDAAASWQALST